MKYLEKHQKTAQRSLEKVAITVICSVFNGEDYLNKYFLSIEQQKLENFELIFVDACSTDRSRSMMARYNPRAGIKKKLIECDVRLGIYQAWNKAIESSSGSWIINYNCDDYLFPEALLILQGVAERDLEHGLVYSPCFISSSPSHETIQGYSNWRNANEDGSLEAGCCCGPFPLVHRQCYEEHGLFDEKFMYSGDYEMWCRLHSAGVRMLKIETPLGTYFRNPKGLSTRPENQERRQFEDTLARQSLLKKPWALNISH